MVTIWRGNRSLTLHIDYMNGMTIDYIVLDRYAQMASAVAYFPFTIFESETSRTISRRVLLIAKAVLSAK